MLFSLEWLETQSSLVLGFYCNSFAKFEALLMICLGEVKEELPAALPTHFH